MHLHSSVVEGSMCYIKGITKSFLRAHVVRFYCSKASLSLVNKSILHVLWKVSGLAHL